MTDREKVLSNEFYEIITDFGSPQRGTSTILDYALQPISGETNIAYINRSNVKPLSITDYSYSSIPQIYSLMPFEMESGMVFNPAPLIRSGITKVQRAPLNLTGRGVVIGFMDTGIRYEEEVFRNPDGSSRILGIWDQTIQSGEPPEGIIYGTEYKKEDIDRALASENPREIVPSYDEIGHGTEIASVAAGSVLGSGLDFLGAAPDADIVMVKLRQAKQNLRDFYLVPEDVTAYAESDMLVALRYLVGFAESLTRPVVICIGMGSNFGDHEGHSILSDYLNRTATMRSRIVIACGGNEGNSAHHYVGESVEGLRETLDLVEIRVGEGMTGFVAELWGSIFANHSISIRAPGGEVTPRVEFREQGRQEFRFIYERTRIQVEHLLVEQSSGEELIFFRFIDPTPGVWTIQVYITNDSKTESTFHIWLPNTDFMKGNTYFLRPSPYTTLTKPSNTKNIITVTSYDDANGSFWTESGRGYTRTGQIKPDISAPGVRISTILGTRTGSALSAALTTGAAAQFMQWAVIESNHRVVETRELKNYLIRGAERVSGDIYPNREGGYGKLDIAGTFEVLAGIY